MDLSKLTQKTLQVSRGLTYTYYTLPARDSKPTLLLFHGWPDTARLWAGLVNDHLGPHGYGVVALDCLGFGGTDKPTDPASYSWHLITADAVEIMDAEKLDTVVSVGHDWGSAMCQRLCNYFPERVRGLVMVNIAYIPPSTGQFDLDAVNAMTRAAFGAGIYEYWHFMTADDSTELMGKNLESVYTMAFAEPRTWLENMCTPGGMRTYVSEGRTQPTLPYATAEHKADFMTRFAAEGSFAAPSCWYRATVDGEQAKSEALVPDEAKVIRVPALFWGGTGDVVCRPELLQPSIGAGLLPNVKSVTREGGHWALLEKPAEFGQDVLDWLQETYK